MSALRIEDELGDLLPPSKIETRNYVDQLSLGYESLNDDIAQNIEKLSDNYVRLWVRALKKFRTFKDTVDGRWLGTLLTGDNQTAMRFEELLNGFQKQFEDKAGTPTLVPHTHKLAQSDWSLSSLTTPLIIGGVVIGGLWLWSQSRK